MCQFLGPYMRLIFRFHGSQTQTIFNSMLRLAHIHA